MGVFYRRGARGSVADLLRHTSSSDPSQEGLIVGYIDDLYWAAPFEKMAQVIAFVQDNR